MGSLEKVSSIVIHTNEGDREIQLMFGDITALPVQEKVDVIMVSAFPGDYSATPTSVIGALKRKLDMSVRELARDKEEDLRKNFCCWWSKSLPSKLPYRRLVCFERTHKHWGSHPSRLVGEVFRAMFPAFNNKESTVITPLLAAGDQGYSEKVMLTSMVNAAANWIRHGLPLMCLKVVIYRGNTELTDTFNNLKTKWEALESVFAEPSVEYDVYLSYSPSDQGMAEEIQKLLKAENSDLNIFAKQQAINEKADFQDEIFDIMIRCVKVVAILSPSYLESGECLEQFNIALCCDRKTKREILAPFYVETIPTLPTYMCMVQYIDVRISGSQLPLFTGCKVFLEQLTTFHEGTGDADRAAVKSSDVQYDVFISYCHKNTEYATELLEKLKQTNPELKIFFDRNELAMGNTWQKALYYAVGGARCMIALVSQDYINSLVCTEEYNLALAKHMCWENSDDSEFYLVPIAIESLEKMPFSFSLLHVLDGRKDFSSVVAKVAPYVSRYSRGKRVMFDIFVDPESPLHLKHVMQKYRKKVYDSQLETMNMSALTGDKSFYIGLSYHAILTKQHAHYLDKLLSTVTPNVRTTFSIQNEAELVTALEKCDLTVALVNQQYVNDRKTSDEFHHAIGRHRTSKNGAILYPVIMDAELQFNPLFFHLVPCAVSSGDWFWKDSKTMDKWKKKLKAVPLGVAERERLEKHSETLLDHEVLALKFACWDIIHTLRKKSFEENGQNVVLNDIVSLNEDIHGRYNDTVETGENFYKKITMEDEDVIKEMEMLKLIKDGALPGIPTTTEKDRAGESSTETAAERIDRLKKDYKEKNTNLKGSDGKTKGGSNACHVL